LGVPGVNARIILKLIRRNRVWGCGPFTNWIAWLAVKQVVLQHLCVFCARSTWNDRLIVEWCLSIRMFHFCKHWTDFHEIWYWGPQWTLSHEFHFGSVNPV
jgi:hypothetical protein